MKHRNLRHIWHCLLAFILLIYNVPSLAADEDAIRFREFSMHSLENTPTKLLADTKIDYELTNYFREGLINGMTLENEIRFEIEWHSDWWWNSRKKLAVAKSELKYHALSQHYQLVRLDTKENWNFSTLASALDKMGTLTDYALPTLPKTAFNNNASIVVSAKVTPKALDLPLKFQTLFSERDSLESEGVVWSIP